MKYEEIIKLLDAGYSREEILAMKEEPTPAPDPEPTPNDPEPAPAPDPAADVMKEMKEMFAEIGEDCYIEPPLHANWGGRHIHFGKCIYANFNLTAVDDTHIYVGDYTMFGPNVTIDTAGHPILPKLRQDAYQYNMPVHIGKNCWIGAGAIILPGVTIGEGAIIQAGSVVVNDIPKYAIAGGHPAKVFSSRDKDHYEKLKKEGKFH